MKLKILIIAFIVLATSCSKPNPEAQKEKLNGYWEIKTVTQPNGSHKDFKISTVIDFIEVKGDSGTRTKVSPKLDGSFTTNGDSESFSLIIENDSLRMNYITPFDNWQETVLIAKDSLLKVKNRDNKVYTYSKFKKFNTQ